MRQQAETHGRRRTCPRGVTEKAHIIAGTRQARFFGSKGRVQNEWELKVESGPATAVARSSSDRCSPS